MTYSVESLASSNGTYTVESVVCDYGVYNEKGELIFLLSQRDNALLINDILNYKNIELPRDPALFIERINSILDADLNNKIFKFQKKRD